MKKTKKCRIAIIGYGGMGAFHASNIKKMDELELVGAYDILPERGEAARKDGLHPYESLEALLEDDSIDLVTIATPNDVHKEISIKAMEAGKHVVCEKPVALNSAELAEMIEASKRNKVIFTVHQNRRWDEDYLVIKKIYDEGRLGRVFNIESRVHGSRGVPGDWRKQKEKGGGMVLDWGVHLFDQLLMMIDQKITSVYATLNYVTTIEVDDGFRAVLTFENGLSCLVEVGTSNFITMPRWYMLGENGTAIVNDWDLSGKIVMVTDWEKKDAAPVVTAAGLTKTMAPRTEETIKEFPLPKVKSDAKDFYRNVVRAIAGEEEQIVKHHEVVRSMKLMEAVFRSAESGQVVYEVI